MACSQELVISLNRLTLPPQLQLHKLTLCATHSACEVFIQNEKVVKGEKVYFYREHLFLPPTNEGFTFNLLRIEPDGQTFPLVSLKVDQLELMFLDYRPTTFKIAHEGFELTWDSWLFRENSSELDQFSDRDYSELDLPF